MMIGSLRLTDTSTELHHVGKVGAKTERSVKVMVQILLWKE